MSNHDRWAYDDLQLRIDRDADGSYRTLAMAPDGRTARGVFHVPLTDDELDNFVQRVGLVRRRRGTAEDRLGAIKELGSSLFDALFAEQVGNVYSAARAAASDGDRRLRITLHLSGAPELMRLPWEFLYQRPRFIAQSTDTPIIRTLDVDSARRPYRLKPPLRILGITSSPVGYQELDAESERRNLETALEPLRREGLVELTWLNRATLRDLARRVSEPDEIHVIHYIGHGAYSEENEAGILVLETPEGRAHDVAGEEIGAMLQDERALRLVVLNSCDGARTSHIDPFSGVATSLIEFDIPAVVGMQFEITDLAAIAFSESLYTGLAHGMPIDAAVGPARRAIMAMTTAEFGTPVLFLRDGDARLFDIEYPKPAIGARPAEPQPAEQPVEPVVNARPAEPEPVEEPAEPAIHAQPAEPIEEPAEPAERAVHAQPAEPEPIEEPARGAFAGPVEPEPDLPAGPPPLRPDRAQRTAARRPKVALGRTLWIIAFSLSIAGLAAWSGFATDVLWLEIFWFIAFGLAIVAGAVAAGVSAMRRRLLGILIPLLSIPLLFAVASGDGSWQPGFLSGTQILLLWWARYMTKSHPKDAPTSGSGDVSK